MKMMCYCIPNYDDNLIFVIFYIKISFIIFFLKNPESVIAWYFLSQFFESANELYKTRFPILIKRTNLHLLFVGQKVIKTNKMYINNQS